MNAQQAILDALYESCRHLQLFDERYFIDSRILWSERELVRRWALLARRGDPSGWREFISYLKTNKDAARGFGQLFLQLGWAYKPEDLKYLGDDYDRYTELDWFLHTMQSIESNLNCNATQLKLTLPSNIPPLDTTSEKELEGVFNFHHEFKDQLPQSPKLGQIMYIEEKPGLAGHARIGRVTLSASRRTIYYRGRSLRAFKQGYKANHFNVESGLRYWISNCKRAGNDTLYPGIVEIDEDARIEYWTEIRRQPQNVHLTRFRSEGKHSKRRPK